MKINTPTKYIPNRNIQSFDIGLNFDETLRNLLKNNPYLSEAQIGTSLTDYYSEGYVWRRLRKVLGVNRTQVKNNITGKKIFVYFKK